MTHKLIKEAKEDGARTFDYTGFAPGGWTRKLGALHP